VCRGVCVYVWVCVCGCVCVGVCVCVCVWVFSVRSAVGKNSWFTFVAVCYKVWEKNILFGGHVCPTVR